MNTPSFLFTFIRNIKSSSKYLGYTWQNPLNFQNNKFPVLVRYKTRRMKRNDPPWTEPQAVKTTQLHLFNSLTRKKEKFFPQKDVTTWYSCGPTTYDDSHMGHARSYVSFDILRRVIQNYFGYPVQYVMNITDIDDKIIKRARMKHLLKKYKEVTPSYDTLVEDLICAFKHHESLILKTEDPTKTNMLIEDIRRAKTALDNLQALKSCGKLESEHTAQSTFLAASESVLGEWLDVTRGKDVSDNSIFADLPRHFEKEFNSDMIALNVLPADLVTRVSEYVPQIVKFVDKIIQNGYAYESAGSVYFDVKKFDAHPDHYYAKLSPEAYGNSQALEEGEGALSSISPSEKQNTCDFALWKKSKQGEPKWPSPWGEGRPGWHIECSAMAGEVLGSKLDIHTGGEDLKFPHHDNEMAQSEAHFGCKQWVNFFLHTGHLHIEGCKMSKSLKNFITIKKALESHNSNQIRMAFLLHQWRDTLDYSSNTMEGSKQYLKMVGEFGLSVDDVLRRCGLGESIWTEKEKTLNDFYNNTRVNVYKSLCDNIDTAAATKHMRDLIAESNKYLNSPANEFNCQLLITIKEYILKILNIFGLELETSIQKDENSSTLVNLATVVGDIREQLRSMAKDKSIEGKELQKKQLQLCDKIRDEMLPPLGIRLEDRDQGAPTIKLVDAQEYMKEIQEKREQEEAKKLEKEKLKEAKKVEKVTANVAEPHLLFKTSEYTAWDENNIPTLDKDGKEVTKSQVKKMTKLMEAHKKKYDKWVQQNSKA